MRNLTCREELTTLIPHNSVAAELGVAKGLFSEALLRNSPRIAKLYSIDAWANDRGGHDDDEYAKAAERLACFGSRSEIVRDTFAHAAASFGDGSLDLIYIDGYAHTGQDGGQTLIDWWPKLRAGGVFAGHDYSERWFPKTCKAVDELAKREGVTVFLTGETECRPQMIYQSWYMFKAQ